MSKHIVVIIFFLSVFSFYVQAQDSTKTTEGPQGQKQVFVDDDGDGYNDNAPDHDKDGIPNGLDPDWIKMKKEEKKNEARRFVDLDGDGIDDNLQKGQKMKPGFDIERNKNGSSMEQENKQQKGQRKQNQNGKK